MLTISFSLPYSFSLSIVLSQSFSLSFVLPILPLSLFLFLSLSSTLSLSLNLSFSVFLSLSRDFPIFPYLSFSLCAPPFVNISCIYLSLSFWCIVVWLTIGATTNHCVVTRIQSLLLLAKLETSRTLTSGTLHNHFFFSCFTSIKSKFCEQFRLIRELTIRGEPKLGPFKQIPRVPEIMAFINKEIKLRIFYLLWLWLSRRFTKNLGLKPFAGAHVLIR